MTERLVKGGADSERRISARIDVELCGLSDDSVAGPPHGPLCCGQQES